MELWSIQGSYWLHNLRIHLMAPLVLVSLPLGLLVNSNTSLVQVFFSSHIFRLSYEFICFLLFTCDYLIIPVLPYSLILCNHSIFITDTLLRLLFFFYFKGEKEKRGNGKRMWKLYILLDCFTYTHIIDRKIYAVLHHCNFAICKCDSWLSLKLWGYGRFAWTAGAFGSLTNGQALPPTLLRYRS